MDAAAEIEVTKEVKPDTLVVCQACKVERPLQEYMHEKPVEAEGFTGVREVGLLCPACGDWTHIRYDTPAMRRLKGSLDRAIYIMRKSRTKRSQKAYYRAKEKYQEAYDSAQATLRPVFGGQSPTELVGQEITNIETDVILHKLRFEEEE